MTSYMNAWKKAALVSLGIFIVGYFFIATQIETQKMKYNFFQLDFSKRGVNNSNDTSVQIGILIPSTTRNIRNPHLTSLSLTKICLPSIYKTMQPEFEYSIYVGINKGDYLEGVSQTLETMFKGVKVVVSSAKTFTKTVNDIARRAYQDGMEYFVRINDDTTFQTKNWASAGIEVLQNYTPPNVGVVGPTCNEGNVHILTHDMVHRTHLDIFDYYYPTYFDNWWADDWITEVYKPMRNTKLKAWVVKHHLNAHGTRYHVDIKKSSRLKTTLALDRERLAEYCGNRTY